MSESKAYLGLDLSLSSAGIAVVTVKDRQATLELATQVKTKPSESHGWRLHAIAKGLRGIKKEYEPFTAVVREQGFSRFAKATQAIFKVVGVSDLLFRDYGIDEISPTTVKKHITGDGKSKKDEVEKGVREALGLDPSYKFTSDDASDAVAVILTHLSKEGIIE